MKKYLWYLVLVAAVAALGAKPSAGKDIGKLQPVQVVWVSRLENAVVVQTDTGDQGAGHTLQAAVEAMTAAAMGEVFLETADHLLLSPDCMDLLPDAMMLLRPSCTLCLTQGEPELEQVGTFLRQHPPNMTLTHFRAGGGELQILKTDEGRMELVS